MRDLDDGVRPGRGRLSAVPGEATVKVQPFLDAAPGDGDARFIEAATALADGATLMETRLRHLAPDDRAAVIDVVAGQLCSLVTLWADLVRRAGGPPALSQVGLVDDRRVPDPRRAADPRGARDRARGPRQPTPAAADTRSHPSAQNQRRSPGADARPPSEARPRTDRPPLGQVTDVMVTRAPTDAGGDPSTPDLVVRRLPRRTTETRTPDAAPDAGPVDRRAGAAGATDLWRTPLRSVLDDDGDYESDRLTRDELTGVLNRQAGFAALGRELDRCRRAGERFVLGYLDVDGLHDINATSGPRAGDELLRQVTAALRATLRSYDVIMRLDGDEFLFSLPGADMTTAELRAHEFGVILAEEAPGASASVGFADLRGNDDTLDEIISRAEIELVKSRRSRTRRR